MYKESEESKRLNGALAYASKIETVEPELAREIRRKAWEEFRERVTRAPCLESQTPPRRLV